MLSFGICWIEHAFTPLGRLFWGLCPFGKAKNQRVYAREFDDRCGEISTFCFGSLGGVLENIGIRD